MLMPMNPTGTKTADVDRRDNDSWIRNARFLNRQEKWHRPQEGGDSSVGLPWMGRQAGSCERRWMPRPKEVGRSCGEWSTEKCRIISPGRTLGSQSGLAYGQNWGLGRWGNSKWVRRKVRSAVGDGEGRKVPLLIGKQAAPRAHSSGQASLKGLLLLLCR